MRIPEILIVDSNLFVRSAMKRLLLSCDRKYSVQEASNGIEAVDFLKTQRVDLIVMDIQMPVLTGIQILKILKEEHSLIKVVVVTQLDEYLLAPHLVKLGAQTLLSKTTSDIDEILLAINITLDGGTYISPAMSLAIRNSLKPTNGSLNLSPREFQILTLLSSGKKNKEMAHELGLEVFTIESYRKSLMKKTNCRNMADIISLAYRIGIAHPYNWELV